jgi:hypothetical protein
VSSEASTIWGTLFKREEYQTKKPSVMMHACNPSTQELWRLRREDCKFEANHLGYIVRPLCQKKKSKAINIKFSGSLISI